MNKKSCYLCFHVYDDWLVSYTQRSYMHTYGASLLQGITGHEMCHYFWDTTVRMEWEGEPMWPFLPHAPSFANTQIYHTHA